MPGWVFNAYVFEQDNGSIWVHDRRTGDNTGPFASRKIAAQFIRDVRYDSGDATFQYAFNRPYYRGTDRHRGLETGGSPRTRGHAAAPHRHHHRAR